MNLKNEQKLAGLTIIFKFFKYSIIKSQISTVNYEVLRCTAYMTLHRPYFSMNSYMHGKWRLNPHTKTIIDAAKCDNEAIPFSEYLKLFEDARKQ